MVAFGAIAAAFALGRVVQTFHQGSNGAQQGILESTTFPASSQTLVPDPVNVEQEVLLHTAMKRRSNRCRQEGDALRNLENTLTCKGDIGASGDWIRQKR